ncbi:hypothetical protein VNO77_15922 [Canavalia gladiata]|uniref:Uncharacterized protein n=1 Tax=Canavalia gladiata TaxID=3824 RepID=A0AAN9QPG6_CANGL
MEIKRLEDELKHKGGRLFSGGKGHDPQRITKKGELEIAGVGERPRVLLLQKKNAGEASSDRRQSTEHGSISRRDAKAAREIFKGELGVISAVHTFLWSDVKCVVHPWKTSLMAHGP